MEARYMIYNSIDASLIAFTSVIDAFLHNLFEGKTATKQQYSIKYFAIKMSRSKTFHFAHYADEVN